MDQASCWAKWQDAYGVLQEVFRNGHMEKLFVSKLDGLRKHSGKKKCKIVKPNRVGDNFYLNSNSQHVWNVIYDTCEHDNFNCKL
jgi:hypothetical protein